MRYLNAGPALTSLLNRLHFGSDAFIVHTTANDAAGNTASSTISGRNTCHATGVVTAHVARSLLTGAHPTGVLHIDQLLPAEPLFGELEQHGIQVRRPQREKV